MWANSAGVPRPRMTRQRSQLAEHFNDKRKTINA
jgi:hypothetical protein